jgi:hypothetical protein
MSDERVEDLRDSVLRDLGVPELWPAWPGGWPNRADLALLDAVYSTRQRYKTSVLPKVNKWRERFPTPEIPELRYLSQIDEKSISDVFGQTVMPGVRSSEGHRKKKSVGVVETATRLCAHEPRLASADDIITEVARNGRKRTVVLLRETKGIGPATASYFLILLGIDGVKVDTLLGSWVRSQLGDPSLTDNTISALVAEVASGFARPARDLDYAIWRHESARRSNRRRSF